MKVVLTAAALVGLIACTADNPQIEARDGDPELYAEQVQPIAAARCAYLGCHGRPGMPLTIYAVDYLRLRDPEGDVDPSRPVLDERALVGAELEHNRRAFAARIGSEEPERDRERFLRRLIPQSEGGIPHAGVVVFEQPDDPDLATIRRFLETVD